MCMALSPRHPELQAIGLEADAIIAQIDARLGALQKAEDDQVRARAIEDAEKLDVVDVYTELRRTMDAKSYDVLTLLPDAPSSLRRLSTTSFTERANLAVASIKALPDGDDVKTIFLPRLEKELAEFATADKAEDMTRTTLKSGRVALTLYKSELSQAREAALGKITGILRDREKTALFTLPWRKNAKPGSDSEPEPAAS